MPNNFLFSSQLWIVLSNVYGELIIIMMMALCLAEVMDTPVPLLSVQVFKKIRKI